jgi:ATP-dependent DNA ligase
VRWQIPTLTATRANGASRNGSSRKARNGGLPNFAAPQLATLTDAPPQGRDWLFEVKFDGYRAIASGFIPAMAMTGPIAIRRLRVRSPSST